MIELKTTTYKDERLGFFADQLRVAQKRYDRLEKAIAPDEPYMSERRQFLSDCGRELSFYKDVIEMLEEDLHPTKDGVKHSKWEISYDGYYPYCLECGYRPREDLTDFCPQCGSRMDGGINA